MGMVACFASEDAATLRRLHDNPDEMEAYLYPDDEESEPSHYVDLDKAWHCIHFMLTGDASGGEGPLALAILGGEEVGEDQGYGPARVLGPADVKRVAAVLAEIDDVRFSARYQPEAMAAADVYLADVCVSEGDEGLDYLLQNYRMLVDFYRGAAERGHGAILWIS